MIINEIFTSIQGEGHLAGKRMLFIRTQGCSVKKCPIRPVCDEPSSLKNKGGFEMQSDEIIQEVKNNITSGSQWVCLTGGEPTDQEDFGDVVGALRHERFLVHIQSSGARRVNCQWDWLTISPKFRPKELKQVYGNELKLVYTGQTPDELRAYMTEFRAWNYYLQPLCSYDSVAREVYNTKETVDMVHKANNEGMDWEFSAQLHKYINVR
tara:strand:- start:372 stop:1001 length:630 start_codon:yes stop_codon:yes gene_type:complete